MIGRLLSFGVFLAVVVMIGLLLNARDRRRAEERRKLLAAKRDAYMASLIGPRRGSVRAMISLVREL
jgi:hypothetical protein